MQLDDFLENRHTVRFQKGREGQAANNSRPCPKINEWFSANRKWPGASHVKYSDFPCYFTCIKGIMSWKPQGKCRFQSRNLPAGTEVDENEDVYNLNQEEKNFVGRSYTVSPR